MNPHPRLALVGLLALATLTACGDSESPQAEPSSETVTVRETTAATTSASTSASSSSMSSTPPTTGECAWPDMDTATESEPAALYCDGEWALVGYANSGVMEYMRFTNGEWAPIPAEGQTFTGFACHDIEQWKAEGAPAELTDAMLPCEAEINVVDPEPFRNEYGPLHFKTSLGGKHNECLIEDQVTCLATPDDSVPNLEDLPNMEPFTGRPGAVTVTSDGVQWGILEGIPPADGVLLPGERLENANAWCQVVDANVMECGAGDNSIRITGPEMTVEQF